MHFVNRSSAPSSGSIPARRPAFTLVELLVVIAIIGILVALLLPAVQSAHESGRRLECGNNLKQIGIAIANYRRTYRVFPSGGLPSPGGGWGHSWMMAILPYAEQSNIYDQFDFAAAHGSDTGRVYGPTTCCGSGNVHNGNLLSGAMIEIYACPSSTLNRWAHKGITPPGPTGVLRPNYAGIAGAVDHPSTEDADDNSHPHNSTGKRSHGGVLILRRHVYGSQIRDGLSSTMMVAEQSDWCRSLNGRQLDCRSDEGHGFQMGPKPDVPGDQRAWNLTSVRYPINSRAWEQKGVGETYYGVNHPILSAHVGAANVLLADGSVQRLSEATQLQVLYNLSNRDDGNPLGAVF